MEFRKMLMITLYAEQLKFKEKINPQIHTVTEILNVNLH